MELYRKAILNDKVPVSLGDQVLFYLTSSFPVIIGVFLIYKLHFTGVNSNAAHQPPAINLVAIFFLALGVCLVILVRKLFRFTTIKTSISNQEKEQIIASIAKKNKWMLLKEETNYFKFTDDFTWTKWPYDITVIYDDNGFYINVLNTRQKPVDFGKKKIATNIINEFKSYL